MPDEHGRRARPPRPSRSPRRVHSSSGLRGVGDHERRLQLVQRPGTPPRARAGCSVNAPGSWRKWSSSPSTMNRPGRRVERAPLDHAAAELQEAHPDLAHDLDAVGLVPLPGGQEHAGRPHGGLEGGQRLGFVPAAPAAPAPRPRAARGRRPPRRGGSWARPSSASRMRSMAASATRGGSPRTGAQVPLVRAPRAEVVLTNRANAVVERGAVGAGRARRGGRAGRPRRHRTARTAPRRPDRRDRSHMANVGLAESTSMPPAAGWSWSGSPRPSQDGAQRTGADGRAERGLDRRLEHLLQVGHQRAGPGQQRGVGQASSRTGRSSRRRSASAFSSSTSRSASVDITQPRLSASFAACRSHSCQGSSTYGGISGLDRSTPGRSARATRRAGGHPSAA